MRLTATRVATVLVAVLASGTGLAAAAAAKPAPRAVKLGVLFVGAHPDDEAGTLPTFGQWHEYNSVKTGVITITRGEGGGNAVGLEEGPALGLLREAEERRAVARAGIANVYNLDKVDFYYTVSAPLTEQAWGHDSTLEKLVRVVRRTRPDVISTMNPAPSPGNHGNHQYAARLAIEAYYAAADPRRFRDQISKEGLQPWRARKLFRSGAAGTGPNLGPTCATAFTPTDASDNVYSVWTGRPSARNGGKTWAQVAREAQREYASQGWHVFPDQPTDPNRLGCNRFTLVASRVPFTKGNTDPAAPLEGALVRARGGLPLGTELYLTTNRFHVAPGQAFAVVAHARAARGSLPNARVALTVPDGWTATGSGALGTVRSAREATARFTVTPPASAATDARATIAATLTSRSATGTTNVAVELAPAVEGTVQRLPQVAEFERWATRVGVEQLVGLVKPVLAVGVGQTRAVRVDLVNRSSATQAGTVTLTLPAGFAAAQPSLSYSGLAPRRTSSVTFQVTNTDTSLRTSNQGGAAGDYDFTITTASGAGSSTETAALELVPVTTVPTAAAAPTVDGVETAGEYPGATLDLSRRWEGTDCASSADCSASAKLTWSADDLYVVVSVTDDVLGTVLPPEDCKRHWRTDSVEIAIDPRGTSENTSTTFKSGLFPVTTAGGPCFERDADANQGPGATTAPGMQVASKVASPYTGYVIEAKIPLALLPAAVDPQGVGLNLFVYDSDTQDKTGQTRIGWSTWGGVQGDPYRWGRASFAGYTPPASRSTEPQRPVLRFPAARSVASPQSILQASRDRVPLAGDPGLSAGKRAWIARRPAVRGGAVTVGLAANGTGTARVFVWGGSELHGKTLGAAAVRLSRGGVRTVRVPSGTVPAGGAFVLVSFASGKGTTSLSARLAR